MRSRRMSNAQAWTTNHTITARRQAARRRFEERLT